MNDPGESATGLTRPPSSRRTKSLRFALVGVVTALALGIGLFVGVGTGSGGPPSTDVEPGIGAPAAALLNLSPISGQRSYRPPNFTLTDQYGHRVSLRSFRNKAIVLSFNDDRCVDLCTLLAQDILAANHDLGAAASHVVFLSVNVNPFYPQVAYVRSWTEQHGLGHTSNWVSTTGPVASLRKVWKDYGIYVGLDRKTKTVVHGTELFFINPQGVDEAIGSFGTNAATTSLYAHTLAQMADDLLPASKRTTIGGPSVPAPSATNATIGARAPSFSLPRLSPGTGRLTSAQLHGHYSVLNFWSSHCSACVGEMPNMERAFRRFGAKVDFVGVDVSDQPTAAAAFAKRVGATYPLVSDRSGTLSGKYQIAGLPYTVVVGPHGTILTLHPGAMTTEQLEYLIASFDPALERS